MNYKIIFLFVAAFFAGVIQALPLEITCGELPKMEGHRFFDGKSVAGATRKFECLSGYRLSGTDSVTCTEEGKWTFGGSCLKKVIDCGPKPIPESCETGYSLEFTTVCGEDGTWITDKKCRKDCPVPIVKYASISFGSNSFDSTREVICKEGYQLTGNSEITCGENGIWSKHPVCQEAPIIEDEIGIISIEVGENSGFGDDTSYKEETSFEKPVVGNISCFNNDTSINDTTAAGYFYFAEDRCNGKYDCVNGVDEKNCREKCIGWRYPTRSDFVDCRAYIPMYYYDFETGNCSMFVYGGCAEVLNMFQTAEECQLECAGILIKTPTTEAPKSTASEAVEQLLAGVLVPPSPIESLEDDDLNSTSVSSISERSISANLDKDDETYVIDMEYDPVHGNISCDEDNVNSTEFYYQTDHCNGKYECTNGRDEFNCTNKCLGWKYPSEDELEHCRASIPMYFFDMATGKCVQFIYGGCFETVNLFRDISECQRECDGVFAAKSVTAKFLEKTTADA